MLSRNKTNNDFSRTLALAGFLVFALASWSFAGETFHVQNVQGDAIVRPAGEYMWRTPAEGQEIDVGDRIRVRNGSVDIRLPLGVVSMNGPGEMEIPAEVVNGLAEPWREDVRLFIGEYAIRIRGGPSLVLRTLFADISGSKAEILLNQTQNSIHLKVLTGEVHVNHRRGGSLPTEVVAAGQDLIIAPSGMRFVQDGGNVYAMKQ